MFCDLPLGERFVSAEAIAQKYNFPLPGCQSVLDKTIEAFTFHFDIYIFDDSIVSGHSIKYG